MARLILAAVLMLVGLAGPASAQNYPNRLIKIMQGFPPGGNVDIIARILASEMEKGLGQSIVVEAKPGLAGALAAETVARADADGYTLLVLPSAHPAYGALVQERQATRWSTISTWISVASFYPFMICVKARLALPDPQAIDRRGARQSRRPEIRLGRRRLDPAHHGRADRQPDQHQVPARALSRRGAGADRNADRRHRFHRRHHRPDQRRASSPANSARSR